MRKNTWYAVYHQRELEYLARSYQPGYFFILVPGGKPLTEYLPIDGSKPMKGNLDLDIYHLLTKYMRIKEMDAYTLGVRNRADTAGRHFRVNRLEFTTLRGYGVTTYLEPYPTDNSMIIIQARDNDTDLMVEVARLKSASEPVLEISRCGNLTTTAISTINTTLGAIVMGNAALNNGKTLGCLLGRLILPDGSGGGTTTGQCRYDAATDTFEIFDGILWKAH